jgi:ABC-2 type transport system permease protein
MFQQIFAIIRNTFLESIRQPIMLVVLMVATIALILSNPLSAFTMADDQRMYIDLGLATVFLAGALLSAFIATNVLGREIENRTALTVISKPVSRPVFVLGKYIGVAGALLVGTIYMSFVFLLAEQHTVLQTVRDPLHVPVLLFAFGAGIIGLGTGIWCNFFYNKTFSSTVICVTTPLAGLAYLFSLMFKPDFSMQPISAGFKPQLWIALAALAIAILVLTAIAVAVSTRLGQVMTLCITVGVFMLGMLSDWAFGRKVIQIEQGWTEKVKLKNDGELQREVNEDEIDELRTWVLKLYDEQAFRQFSTWHCGFLAAVEKQRIELNRLNQTEREARIAALEGEFRSSAETRLTADLAGARQAAEAIRWPPAKSDLVHEMDWPLSVERTNGECELIANKKTFVYPPVQSSVADGQERLTRRAFQVAGAIVPNFQVLFLSDALTQGHMIPLSYLWATGLYGLCYIVAALSLATFLFQGREVG